MGWRSPRLPEDLVSEEVRNRDAEGGRQLANPIDGSAVHGRLQLHVEGPVHARRVREPFLGQACCLAGCPQCRSERCAAPAAQVVIGCWHLSNVGTVLRSVSRKIPTKALEAGPAGVGRLDHARSPRDLLLAKGWNVLDENGAAAASPAATQKRFWSTSTGRLAIIAGIMVVLIGGLVWFLNRPATADHGPSGQTAQEFLAAIGCSNPQASRKEGTEAGTWYSCQGGGQVVIFDDAQAQREYLLRVQGNTRSNYLIMGSGWAVITYDRSMAAAALGQGGQQL